MPADHEERDVPPGRRCRPRRIDPAGLALGLVAALADGAAGPLPADLRPALAVLLLGGWVALTVAGSLLHLLAVLARVRHLALRMPAPRPARDRAVAAGAALAVVTWAVAQAPGVSALDTPALVLRLVATLALAAHVVRAAVRAGVPRGRPAPARPLGERRPATLDRA